MTKAASPQLFASVAVGEKIAKTAKFEITGQIDPVGHVIKVWPARFEVEFPPIGPLTAPWRCTFRRTDGRSVGGRQFSWAKAAVTDAWQQVSMAALHKAGYEAHCQGENLIVRDPVHRSEGGQLVVCGFVERTLICGNAVTKFLYDRS